MAEDGGRLAAATNAIRENFNRGAPDYDKFEERNAFFRELSEKLLELAPPKSGQRVLDVGCGTGASLALLTELVGPTGCAVGLDNAQGMLDVAREKLGSDQRLVCADGCDFGELFACEFDLVVYNAVLFLLPDAERSLTSALKVLKPDGSILFSNLDGVTIKERPVADLLSEAGHNPGRHFLSPWAKVEEAARRLFCDLTAIKLERTMSPAVFREFYSLEPMSAGLLPKTPYPERLRIIGDLADRCEAEGVAPVQRWMLGCASKSSLEPRPG